MKSNIIKKKPLNYINGLKAITTWLFNNKRKKEDIENIIDLYGIDNSFIKRFFLYTYNSPHLTYYINKYLNHLYNFNKFDTVDLLFSLAYLLDVNRLSRKNIPEKLLYLKNTELADKNKQKIKEILYDYFDKLFDKTYDDSELNYFYDLVNLNVITYQDIEQIDKHLNGDKSSFKLETSSQITQKITNSQTLDIYRELSDDIKNFCNQAKQFILSRDECKKCELFGKPTVILDTNMETGGEVDIAFIGLNPGTEEVEIGKPFVGKSGKILRERMSLLPSDVKWIIYNVILCHTKNENEIKNPEDVKTRCKDLVNAIAQTFPAKIHVPLGAKAFDWFGLKGTVGSLSGKIFKNNNTTIIPIMHPSSANYNHENLGKFKDHFQAILDQFKTANNNIQQTVSSINKISTQTTTTQKTNIEIPENSTKIITSVTPDLTFFDVREINDKILKIYIDQNGQKRYFLTDYSTSFYVKNANWKQCDQITDKIDGKVIISGKDKYQVTKKIRDKFTKLKENGG